MKRIHIFILFSIFVTLMFFGFGYLVHADINEKSEIFLFDAMILEDRLNQGVNDNKVFKDCPYNSSAVNRAAVSINNNFLQPMDIDEKDLITVNLFSGYVCTLEVQKTQTDINGVNSVSGTVLDENGDYGYFYLSCSDGVVLLTLDLFSNNTKYVVSYNGLTENHYLYEIPFENTEFPENIAPLTIPSPSPEDGFRLYGMEIPEIAGDPLEHVVIDVMVVYTPNAEAWANANGGINTIINQAMEKGNTALNNSNTFMNINLVHSAQVNYTESNNGNNSILDIQRLQNPNSGYMDEVHVWRDEYGADLVAIFTFCHDTGGLGYALEESHLNFPAWSAQHGFSLTRVQQAAWTYTFIHELGHNMGAGHHKEQNVQPGPQCFNYSAGWRWSIGSSWYNSVMSYSNGKYFSNGITSVSAPYFSNPDINHLGVPTGHEEDADNARTLRETKHFIAGYREAATVAVESVSLNRNTLTLTSNGLNNTETLIATVYPPEADNKEVIWSTDNPNVALVSQNGTVEAVGVGEAVITVTTDDGGYTDTCLVTVKWHRLTTSEALILVTGDITGDGKANPLATFAFGTFYWDEGWTRLTTSTAEILLTADITGDGKDNPLAAFSFGTFYWDEGWERLTTSTPEILIAADITGDGKANPLAAFSFGTFYWDEGWERITTSTPEILIAADLTGDGKANPLAAFSFGTFYWDEGWERLTTCTPLILTAADLTGDGKTNPLAAFSFGTFFWDEGWERITTSTAEILLTADITGDGKANPLAAFSFGMFYWDEGWTRLTTSDALLLTAGDMTGDGKANPLATFSFGTFYWDEGWERITTSTAEVLLTADITGDGKENPLVKFHFGTFYWRLIN